MKENKWFQLLAVFIVNAVTWSVIELHRKSIDGIRLGQLIVSSLIITILGLFFANIFASTFRFKRGKWACWQMPSSTPIMAMLIFPAFNVALAGQEDLRYSPDGCDLSVIFPAKISLQKPQISAGRFFGELHWVTK